jgi:hypothetical protein
MTGMIPKQPNRAMASTANNRQREGATTTRNFHNVLNGPLAMSNPQSRLFETQPRLMGKREIRQNYKDVGKEKISDFQQTKIEGLSSNCK